MKIKAYTWAGVRTDNFDGTIDFFADVLGLPLVSRDDDGQSAMFKFQSGQDLEIFGAHSEYYQLHACPGIGFEVEDIQAARAELEAKAVHFVTEIKGSPDVDGAAWCYFRGPDGFLFELIQRSPKSE